jgi:hypothetical protein
VYIRFFLYSDPPIYCFWVEGECHRKTRACAQQSYTTKAICENSSPFDEQSCVWGKGICYSSDNVTCDKLEESSCGIEFLDIPHLKDCEWRNSEYGCVKGSEIALCGGQKSRELCELVGYNQVENEDKNCVWDPFGNECRKRSCDSFEDGNISCQIGNLLLGGNGCFWVDSICKERELECSLWDNNETICEFNGSVVGTTCFYVENITDEATNDFTTKCVKQELSCGDWDKEFYCVHNNSLSIRGVSCEFVNSECRVTQPRVEQASKSSSGGTVVAIVLAIIFGILAAALLVVILIYLFRTRIWKQQENVSGESLPQKEVDMTIKSELKEQDEEDSHDDSDDERNNQMERQGAIEDIALENENDNNVGEENEEENFGEGRSGEEKQNTEQEGENRVGEGEGNTEGEKEGNTGEEGEGNTDGEGEGNTNAEGDVDGEGDDKNVEKQAEGVGKDEYFDY